jgi:hypothetical protein
MRWSTVCLFAVCLLGCSEEPALPDVSAAVLVSWKFAPQSLAELGFTIDVVVTQRPAQGARRCRPLPASARFTIDGEAVTNLITTAEGCLDMQVTKGPLLDWDNAPVIVRYEEDGRLIGEGVFSNLAPGTAATLTVPASHEVHAGDEIVVLPPPEEPTSYVSSASFFPLDEASSTTWPPYGVSGGGMPTRLADGIHLTVPPMVGRAAVTMRGMPYVPRVNIVCTGYALCDAYGANTLGPLLITVLP